MRIKSYFADSVQEAIEKARIELGPDAMLMNSKKTDFELRGLGSFEVVFGLPGQTVSGKARLQSKAGGGASPAAGWQTAQSLSNAAPAAPSAENSQASGYSATGETTPALAGEVAQELAELRRQIETVKRSMSRQQRSNPNSPQIPTPAAEKICARLIAADISEDLALEIAEAVEMQAFEWKQSPSRAKREYEMIPSENWELALAAELEKRFQVSPELGSAGSKQKVVLFVGPAGAGKTTSLIKLGLRCGLQARLPMHMMSLDTLRVGGWEHLAAYARIAGLSFDAVHSLTSLDQLLSQHANKKLILIDTPGFGPADTEDLNDLSHWIQQKGGMDVQLVMPATLRTSVFSRMLERFSSLQPTKLLLTRADEADAAGVLLDFAMRSGLPLSYISNGQTIPEDIEQPSKAKMLAALSDWSALPSRLEAA